MKKQIQYIMGAFILVLVIAANLTISAKAYTEEEKQQAKEWLSAHGYSPDMGGASQAYQDYLDGKFDEELGYDTNGDGIPPATTESVSENSRTEGADGTGKGDTKLEQEASTEKKFPDEARNKTTERNTEKRTDTQNQDGVFLSVEEEKQMEEKGQQQVGEADTIDGNLTEGKSAEQKNHVCRDTQRGSQKGIQQIDWYRPEKIGHYQEAVTVIILGVLAMWMTGLFVR